jgi:LacI family transcriptional regulator
MAATIYEIAARAGVSSSTVARVLRGDVKGASPRAATRVAHIRRLAEEMGYRRNWRARAFSNCKTHALGLFHTNTAWICEGTMGEIAGAFANAARDLGYHVVIVPYDAQGKWRELISDGRLDGVAVSHYFPDEAGESLLGSGLPRVLLMDKSDQWPCVHSDDFGGAYAATKHLIELGHRSIAMYLHDSIREHFSVADRRIGYEAAMGDAGLAAASRFWHLPENRLDEMFAGERPPTAIMCYCHVEAMAIYLYAWRRGWRIPQDLSVIAFNELQTVRYMTPPLTTMGFDTAKIGRIGAELLIRQIESSQGKNGRDEHVVVTPQLVPRESTASPDRRESAARARKQWSAGPRQSLKRVSAAAKQAGKNRDREA